MKYTHLGRSGLKVSRVCLGTMNFGPQTSEADSFAIMDKALEIGINFFDTADVYGRKQGEGVTEKILGRWFDQGGARRERVVLATKVFGSMDSEHRADVNLGPGLSARKIIRCCEDSLRRMKTDFIDLYQMHHVDRECPLDEIWQAMETLQRQGKVLYVGSSNFAGWDIATACQEARRRNHYGLCSEQSIYSLTERAIELEVIPACRNYGLGVIPWSPLAGGLLGGALEKHEEGRRSDPAFADRVTRLRPQLEAYETLCREIGSKPGSVGLAWLLHNPVVTAPIIGPRTMEQLQGAAEAVQLQLPPEVLRKLDEIWPGPGGEAPKPYAW